MNPNAWLVILGIAYPVALVILFAAGGWMGPLADPFFYSAFFLPVLLIGGVLGKWGDGARFARAAVLVFVGWVILIWLVQWQIIYMASAAV